MPQFFEKFYAVKAFFSEAKDGNMKYELNEEKILVPNVNRIKFLQSKGLQEDQMVGAVFEHTNKVAVVRKGQDKRILVGYDALVTPDTDVFVSGNGSDCYPHFIYGDGICGVAHGGSIPLANGILTNTIEKMKNLGAREDQIFVEVGAGVCQPCYGYHKKDLSNLGKYNNEDYFFEVLDDPEKVRVDLKRISRHQLNENGITDDRIKYSKECTCCLPQKYFSARRHNREERYLPESQKTPYKVMLAVIGMRA